MSWYWSLWCCTKTSHCILWISTHLNGILCNWSLDQSFHNHDQVTCIQSWCMTTGRCSSQCCSNSHVYCDDSSCVSHFRLLAQQGNTLVTISKVLGAVKWNWLRLREFFSIGFSDHSEQTSLLGLVKVLLKWLIGCNLPSSSFCCLTC